MTNSYPAHQVSTKTYWTDASWSVVPYLYCNRFTSVASPGLSTASLTYRFGRGQRPGASAFATYSPQNLTDKLVRIEAVGLPPWYGVIVDRLESRLGAFDDSGTRIPNGVESYTAVGLEYFLDRQPITSSYYLDSNGDEQQIGRAIPFNGGNGYSTQSGSAAPNASATLSATSAVRLFSQDLTSSNAITWTDREAIEYLLKKFPPEDNQFQTAIPFELDYTSSLASIDWASPTFSYDGLTLRQILDRLISRRKGVGWKLIIDDEAGKVLIHVFTFAETNISLPSGAVVYANENPITIDLDRDGDTRSFTVRDASTEKFDQVVARGARRGSVVTLSKADETLDSDWSATSETGYETAATASGGYSGASTAEKESMNTDARKRDVVARVYSWFRLPNNWNGTVKDGENGTVVSGTRPAFPTLDANGDPTSTASTVWSPGLLFESKLPLLEAHEYTGNKIDAGTVTNNAPDNSAPEFLEPFVLLKCDTSRWAHCEHLGEAQDSGDTARAHNWSANLTMRRDGPGLILKVVGGHQHYMASADFTAQAGESFDSDLYVNWREMVATVYMMQDDYAESVYPDDASVANVSVKRQLLLSVPDAHLDWVPAGTVVSVGPGGDLERCTTGAFVRDDRNRLKDIARSAWQWHGADRKVVSFKRMGFYDTWQVGQLVTTIGSGATQKTVNTVITSVEFDLIDGSTTVETQFANVEFT